MGITGKLELHELTDAQLLETARRYRNKIRALVDRLKAADEVVEKMTRAMNEAKVEPCWDKMPSGIHYKVDIIFKALAKYNNQRIEEIDCE